MVDFIASGNLTIDDVVSATGRVDASIPGGSGLYAAIGMWLWGHEVGLCAGVGAGYPTEWLDAIEQAGIDTRGIYELADPHAMRSRAFYRPDGTRTDRVEEADLPSEAAALIDLSSDYSAMGSDHHREAWPRYSPDADRLPDLYRAAKGGHLAPAPHGNLRSLLSVLRRPDSTWPTLTLDWPWWDEDETGFADDLLAAVTAVLPGAEELARVPVGGDVATTLSGLRRRCPTIVVKQGSQGATVLTSAEHHVPALAVDVVDATGAGDAFCGGFCVGLTVTGNPVIAAAYGAVSASFVVETSGALAVLGTERTTVRERLAAMSVASSPPPMDRSSTR